MNENKLREQICTLASSMFDRGITHGSTGNISVRLDNDDILVTPSGSSFGRLDPNEIVKVTKSGQFIGSLSPTKELPLHKAFYETRGMKSGAVVHLHSTHSVAVSMLPDVNEDNILPSFTFGSIASNRSISINLSIFEAVYDTGCFTISCAHFHPHTGECNLEARKQYVYAMHCLQIQFQVGLLWIVDERVV